MLDCLGLSFLTPRFITHLPIDSIGHHPHSAYATLIEGHSDQGHAELKLGWLLVAPTLKSQLLVAIWWYSHDKEALCCLATLTGVIPD